MLPRALTSLDSPTFFPLAQDPTDALPKDQDCELGSIVKGSLQWDHSTVNLFDKRWCAF